MLIVKNSYPRHFSAFQTSGSPEISPVSRDTSYFGIPMCFQPRDILGCPRYPGILTCSILGSLCALTLGMSRDVLGIPVYLVCTTFAPPYMRLDHFTVQASGKVNVYRGRSTCVLHPARGRISSWLRVLCGRPTHAEASTQTMAINFWAWSSYLKVRS